MSTFFYRMVIKDICGNSILLEGAVSHGLDQSCLTSILEPNNRHLELFIEEPRLDPV